MYTGEMGDGLMLSNIFVMETDGLILRPNQPQIPVLILYDIYCFHWILCVQGFCCNHFVLHRIIKQADEVMLSFRMQPQNLVIPSLSQAGAGFSALAACQFYLLSIYSSDSQRVILSLRDI